MRTKTGNLLMKKRQENSHRSSIVSLNQEYNKTVSKKNSQIILTSKVSEYTIEPTKNQKTQIEQIHLDKVKQLEIQNYRLIESQMTHLKKSKQLSRSIKSNLLKVVYLMDQFKYLQGVNLLYDMIQFADQFERFHIPVPLQKQSKKVHNNPQSGTFLDFQKQSLKVYPKTVEIQLTEFQSHQIKQLQENDQEKNQKCQYLSDFPLFSFSKKESINSQDIRKTTVESCEDYYRMILVQSLQIQKSLELTQYSSS